MALVGCDTMSGHGAIHGCSTLPAPLTWGTSGWGGGGGAALCQGTGTGMMGTAQYHPVTALKPMGAAGLTWACEMQESSLTAELFTLTPLTLALSLIVSQAQGAGPGRADGGDCRPPCPREGGPGQGLCPSIPNPVLSAAPGTWQCCRAGPSTAHAVQHGHAQPSMPRSMVATGRGGCPLPSQPLSQEAFRSPQPGGQPSSGSAWQDGDTAPVAISTPGTHLGWDYRGDSWDREGQVGSPGKMAIMGVPRAHTCAASLPRRCAWCGTAQLGMAQHGLAWYEMVWYGRKGLGMVRHCTAWHGLAQHDWAQHGKAQPAAALGGSHGQPMLPARQRAGTLVSHTCSRTPVSRTRPAPCPTGVSHTHTPQQCATRVPFPSRQNYNSQQPSPIPLPRFTIGRLGDARRRAPDWLSPWQRVGRGARPGAAPPGTAGLFAAARRRRWWRWLERGDGSEPSLRGTGMRSGGTRSRQRPPAGAGAPWPARRSPPVRGP